MVNNSETRKRRRSADNAVKHAERALALSRNLLARGYVNNAARATQLAERQAKLADRLIDLDASLKRIAEAKRAAEQQLAERYAQLTKREAAIAARERTNAPAEDYSWVDVRNPRFQAWYAELMAAKDEREKSAEE